MKTMLELVLLMAIAVFVLIYRKNPQEGVYNYVTGNVSRLYDKYAPYSFKLVRAKAKELGQEYTTRQYVAQVALFGGFAALVGYFYFYSNLSIKYFLLK